MGRKREEEREKGDKKEREKKGKRGSLKNAFIVNVAPKSTSANNGVC